MAGEWLKIEHHLAEKPEVLQIAATCEIEPDLVVGRLIKVWSWASRNCLSGGKAHIAARKGEPPTAKLNPEWRQRLEDILWAMLNAPEWAFSP